ncbi:MAG TPA: hypothetical protein VHT28_13570, partial [Silvibacterium sp.]|nr:hypothetical protein [Silvibacterium sp.]
MRLVTFFPLRPDFSFPCFIAFISRSTDLEAFGLYFLPLDFFFAELFFATLFFVGIAIPPHSEKLAARQGLSTPGLVPGVILDNYGFLSEAMSITKRYFTSAFTTRS